MQAAGGPPGSYGGPGPPPQSLPAPMPAYNNAPQAQAGGGGFEGGGFGAPPVQGGFDGNPRMSMGGAPLAPDVAIPGGVAAVPVAVDDIGPFMRPIFNKLVRALSALTSLIALILHFMVLGQGITSYMTPAKPAKSATAQKESNVKKENKQEKKEVVEETEEEESTSTRRRTSTSRTRSRTRESPTLLGDRPERLGRRALRPAKVHAAPTQQTPAPTATAHLLDRRLLAIRQNAAAATASPTPNYVPNSDVPLRDGAVGFTASSHLFAAFVILLLFWLEWMLFMRKPTLFSYWGPLIIAVVQLYMAFDILGRSLNAANQAGGYVLLLLAVINVFIAGWTVLHAKKMRALLARQSQNMAPPMMAEAPMMAEQPPLEPQLEEGFLPPPDAGQNEAPMDAGQMEDDAASPRSPRRGRRSKSRRRSTGTSYDSGDLDPYYGDYPSRDRRHSYSYGQDYIAAAQPAPINNFTPTTPISLYGPQEYQRRLENQRRARGRSLTQPAMQFDPTTGQYIQPAANFNARTMQTLPDVREEEEQDFGRQAPQRPNDPNSRQDGFANRTRVWKRLQNDSGLIL